MTDAPNRVQRPSEDSRSRVGYLVQPDTRLIDMLGYAYELGIRDTVITMKEKSK